MDNICEIFNRNGQWKSASKASWRRWGTPPWSQLAIVHQESRFNPYARNPRSSAYGFSQALNGTWGDYKRSTRNWGASRSNIEDSLDFIGWYNDNAQKIAGISKRDMYEIYLAYHEGAGGYKKGSYHKKPWLKRVARKVQKRAVMYKQQYASCS